MKNKLTRVLMVMTVVALVASFALPVAGVQAQGGLLTNIPVVGDIAGGTFEGVLSITGFAFENGQLLVSGVLSGTATLDGVVTEITQTFTNIAADLLGTGGRCDILTLDIPGGIEIDLLGLVIDLAPVQLDIFALSGQGNLLGNLLCAVAGLLDNGGPLSGITRLLDRVNNLL